MENELNETAQTQTCSETRIAPCDPQTAYVPIVARVGIAIRPATLADLPFIDRLQKQHSRELGFLPTAALEGKVRLGQVLIAEKAVDSQESIVDSKDASSLLTTDHRLSTSHSLGYLIAADRYQKRDEIGYVTQINVVPDYRRSLVAAQLLQAQFDRSAYGCKLYSCWCAQDLKANAFWEAMGFTAIAFRTGSMKRGKRGQWAADRGQQDKSLLPTAPLPLSPSARVHIFWQKRIRAGDTSTPWWYPSQTGGGVIRADRLVFPIMPGVHWRDVGPIVLDAKEHRQVGESASREMPVAMDVASTTCRLADSPKKRTRAKKSVPEPVVAIVSPRARGGFWAAEEGVVDTFKTQKQLAEEAKATREVTAKTKRAAKQPATATESKKIDPRLMAMSRELRDQWTERAEAIVSPTIGKHDVKRIARASNGVMGIEPLRIEQAA